MGDNSNLSQPNSNLLSDEILYPVDVGLLSRKYSCISTCVLVAEISQPTEHTFGWTDDAHSLRFITLFTIRHIIVVASLTRSLSLHIDAVHSFLTLFLLCVDLRCV